VALFATLVFYLDDAERRTARLILLELRKAEAGPAVAREGTSLLSFVIGFT